MSAALLFWCAVSPAATPRVEAPAECGSGAEFEEEVRRRLSPELVVPPVSLVIRREAQRYRLSMQVGRESRELQDLDCRQLFHAAVVVTVAIVSSERTEPRRTDETPSSTPRRAGSERTHALTRSSNLTESRVEGSGAPFDFGMSVGGGVSIGLLPRSVLAFELEGKALSGAWGLALGGRYLTSASEQDAALRGLTVSAIGGYGAALLKPTPHWEARLGIAAYRLSGSGLGSLETSSDAAWTGGPVAGLAWMPFFRSGAWAGFSAEGQLHVVRSRFEILNYGEIFSVPIVSGSVFLRLGWQFP